MSNCCAGCWKAEGVSSVLEAPKGSVDCVHQFRRPFLSSRERLNLRVRLRSHHPTLISPISRQSAAPPLPIGGDLGVCIRPCDGGPKVRILLPPAESRCKPGFLSVLGRKPAAQPDIDLKKQMRNAFPGAPKTEVGEVIGTRKRRRPPEVSGGLLP